MTTEEIKHTLELHGKWLRGEDGGVRADFSRASLPGVNLREANLREANLHGAYLYKCDLYGCDLRGANLRSADLYMGKNIMQFGPMPTSGRMIYAVRHDSGWMVRAGCFWGTVDELEAKVKASHNCPAYFGFIEILKKLWDT